MSGLDVSHSDTIYIDCRVRASHSPEADSLEAGKAAVVAELESGYLVEFSGDVKWILDVESVCSGDHYTFVCRHSDGVQSVWCDRLLCRFSRAACREQSRRNQNRK